MIIEAVRTDHGCDADGGNCGNCELRWKQDVETDAMIEIGKVTCGLLGIVVMRSAAIVCAVVMMHDEFYMLAVMLDERRRVLLAVHDVREIAFHGSCGLPRKEQHQQDEQRVFHLLKLESYDGNEKK